MILKNGKRIDGCSDTVPVGTLNPFLGLTPPAGYLICQGQLVSKQLYPELYAICGNTFGTATATEFYLPDLRGKTITGYKAGDSTFGVLGALIGDLTHIHSTGNHTLTIEEMPSHNHNMHPVASGSSGGLFPPLGTWSPSMGTLNSYTSNAGGDQPHNHGNTSSTSSLQPSINLNWIVKAVMLIPVNSIVENNLTSTSTTNALSAAQGKILNDKIPSVINNLTSTSTTNALSAAQGKILNEKFSNYALTSSLKTVATTGSYNDLTNKPTIPTTLSQLSNNANYGKGYIVSGKNSAAAAIEALRAIVPGLTNETYIDAAATQIQNNIGSWNHTLHSIVTGGPIYEVAISGNSTTLWSALIFSYGNGYLIKVWDVYGSFGAAYIGNDMN